MWVRDPLIVGRPVVICWHKRVWRRPHRACPKRTWTETHPAIAPRSSLAERARAWVLEQVGVGWYTVMRVVTVLGTPLVDRGDVVPSRARSRGRCGSCPPKGALRTRPPICCSRATPRG